VSILDSLRGALRLEQLTERLRQSLFVIPGSCLLVGAVLGEAVVRIDRADAAGWLPDGRISIDTARSMLTAIATGTITVVTLLLTLTLVAIQLAAGQLSPRTITNFLGDRVQQATVGVVLGTASFSLFALRALDPPPIAGPPDPPGLTVLLASALTLGALVMVVFSVDRTANRLSVGTLLRDLATETCGLVERRYGTAGTVGHERPAALVTRPSPRSSAWPVQITTQRAGWVQLIDEDAVIDAVPEGATIELRCPVGTFVLPDMVLARLDVSDLGDAERARIRGAIAIGDHRTMQQDVGFGLTRLTDIGLRALSPGVNDPNTAREAILRSAQVVLVLLACDLGPATVEVDGRVVVRAGHPGHDGFVYDAFDQLREAAHDDIATLHTLARVLTTLMEEVERRDLPGSVDELDRQRELVERALAGRGRPATPDRWVLR
jgi:uncharacterized membrane protein